MTGARVLVAMSGGVDSAVAAGLLKEQGYDLVGVTLHLWDAEGAQQVGRCCAPEDREDARKVCDHLGIPHYVLDERTAFRTQVVTPFVEANLRGDTPSPCVACNQHVKLTRLAEIADSFGASHIATGHYAQIVPDAQDHPRLLRGHDRHKDQSYFLFGVPPAVRRRLLLPLGTLTKDESRAHGQRLGLPNWAKPDSQELCFVPDGDVGGFVARHGRGLAAAEGAGSGTIVDEQGQVLGQHDGVARFTVGQRRGLGLGGGGVRYVLRVVAEQRQVVVGPETALFRDELQVTEAMWTAPRPREPFAAQLRIRYQHHPAEAWITPQEQGFAARFAEPQRAIAPGQAAVIYQGDMVIGGGYIAAD